MKKKEVRIEKKQENQEHEHFALCEMTDQQIEAEYAGNDALISIKKLEKIKILIDKAYDELDEFKGEDISVFIGNSRSGKSTVINSILNNTMFAEIKRKVHISISPYDKGPEIGNQSVSKTSVPSRYKTKDFGVIWDCPGYGDNRGDTQDIVNNFCIKRLIEGARSVKLFVVSDINDVDVDGVPGLIALTKSIDLSFGKKSKTGDKCLLDDLINRKAIGMIVTKSNYDDEDEIKELYKKDFLDDSGISKSATADDLLSYFTGKFKAMCITPRIIEEYIDEDKMLDNSYLRKPVFSLFSSLKALKISDDFSMRPGLSPSAQKFIYSCYTEDGMISEFKNFFKLLEGKFSSYLSAVDLSDKAMLKKLLVNIENKIEYIDKFVEDISSFNSFKNLVVSLKDSLPSFLDPVNKNASQSHVNYIEEYFKEHCMVSQVAFLDFLSSSVFNASSSLRAVIEKFLSDLKSDYSENMNHIYFQLGKIREDEYLEEKGKLLKERESMESSYKADLKKVEEEKTKQAKKFAEQHKLDLAAHQFEQEKIKLEMFKKIKEEKDENAKKMEQKSKEWEQIQKKLVTDHSEKLETVIKSHAGEVSMIRKEKEDLKSQLANERAELKEKVNQMIIDKKVSGDALAILQENFHKLEIERTKDAESHRAQIEHAHQIINQLQNRPPQIVERVIVKKRGGGGPCVIFSAFPKYDNPLLNDEDLVKDVKNKFGDAVLNNFIDLCSNFTDEEYNQISSSDDVMDSVRSLMGLFENMTCNDISDLT